MPANSKPSAWACSLMREAKGIMKGFISFKKPRDRQLEAGQNVGQREDVAFVKRARRAIFIANGERFPTRVQDANHRDAGVEIVRG